MAKRGIKGITTTVAVVIAIITLIVGLVVGMVVQAYTGIVAPPPKGLTGEIKIGAILTMTGDLATYGENEKTAAELAISEVNEFLEKAGAGWTMKLVVEDTQCLPDVCLEKVESLHAKGIDLLIGPLSSGELSNIMTYCNTEKILTISQSSTAPALGAPDFVFRFCPNDAWQGRAIARLMYDLGIRYVIPTWRADAWGDGLKEHGELRFEELGGNFSDEYVRYSVPREDFSVEASTLNDIVTDALATHNASEVAVWVISFEEIAAYMHETAKYPNLAKVRWFGSDGTVNTPGLIVAGADESEFAATTNFTNPIFAPARTWKYEKVHDYIMDQLGREPDSYSYNVYDMVWAYAYALLTTQKYDPEAIREVLPDVVKSMYGAAGWVDFDENGDRKPTDYDLWLVSRVAPGEYEWVLVGKWILDTDTIQWL
jgi:branched-chain amino acid transport system substrate-binding protein